MIHFIGMLRLLAIALITNSHFDGVYPANFSFGGVPGVCLFFLITGFLLTGKGIQQSPLRWYGRKVRRIYPAVILACIFMIALGDIRIETPADALKSFIFPTQWWYVECILILYAAFYVIRRYAADHIGLIMTAAADAYLIIFAASGEFDRFVVDSFWYRLCYGLIAMLAGSMLRDRWNAGQLKTGMRPFTTWGIASCLSMGFFLIMKVLTAQLDWMNGLQFLVHAASVLFAWCACHCFAALEPWFCRHAGHPLFRMGMFISASSLEIYLLQQPVIDRLRGCGDFPINLILMVTAILAVGCCAHWCIASTSKLLTRIGRRS